MWSWSSQMREFTGHLRDQTLSEKSLKKMGVLNYRETDSPVSLLSWAPGVMSVLKEPLIPQTHGH